MTSAQFASELDVTFGLQLMRDVVLGGGQAATSAPSQAQLAVIGGSVRFTLPADGPRPEKLYGSLLPVPGSPADRAARRFAALPAVAKHAWLVQHLAALRAGRVSLAQLP